MVRLEWYEDIDCACEDRYEREAEPRVLCMLVDPLGVLGTASDRELRAVRGVGALMRDFFGVSVTFVLRLPRFEEAVCSKVLAVLGVGATFLRLPAVMYGCRIAACGFNRRSGSHTKHFEMKSTKRSSEGFFSACARVLVPGLRLLPFEFTTGRGVPVVSIIQVNKGSDLETAGLTEEEPLARAAIDEVLVRYA